jgi:replicative DNA helicase
MLGSASGALSSLPHNFHAEQQILACILVKESLLDDVLDFVKPEHFSYPLNAEIYSIMLKFHERRERINPITMRNYIDNGSQESYKYMIELASEVISLSGIKTYGNHVYDSYLRRCLMEVGMQLSEDAQSYTIQEPVRDKISRAEQKIYEIAVKQYSHKKQCDSFSSVLKEVIKTAYDTSKNKGALTGVTSGLKDLDNMLGGMHPSDLIILAGRPSMGKTALATNMAFSASYLAGANKRGGAPVAFFSLEMSSTQLAQRILAGLTSISSHKIRRGLLTQDDMIRMEEMYSKFSKVPFVIDDTPALTVSTLWARARRLKNTMNIGALYVDYLQLLTGESGSRDGRVQEISEISRTLKAIAKDLNIPVIALSQLSRAVEQREDKRPQLSDLRESGSIEQDADVVMFVYREAYYLSRSSKIDKDSEEFRMKENMAEIIIAKQRHGPIGTVMLKFLQETTEFCDLDQENKNSFYN